MSSSAFDSFLPTHAALAKLEPLIALKQLQERVRKFQAEKFPRQPLAAKIEHLNREVKEMQLEPRNVIEYADTFLLFIACAQASGFTFEEIIWAAQAKMDINEKRTWGDPDAQGVVHHVEEER